MLVPQQSNTIQRTLKRPPDDAQPLIVRILLPLVRILDLHAAMVRF